MGAHLRRLGRHSRPAGPSPTGNTASAAWRRFLSLVEYKCEREGTHFVAVNPRGTTKKCASCGVLTDKPLWVREHPCPACGFEANRDANAAWNILSCGLEDVGVGHSESAPVETALPVDTSVSAKRVVEAGSPTLKERTASAVSEQGRVVHALTGPSCQSQSAS